MKVLFCNIGGVISGALLHLRQYFAEVYHSLSLQIRFWGIFSKVIFPILFKFILNVYKTILKLICNTCP